MLLVNWHRGGRKGFVTALRLNRQGFFSVLFLLYTEVFSPLIHECFWCQFLLLWPVEVKTAAISCAFLFVLKIRKLDISWESKMQLTKEGAGNKSCFHWGLFPNQPWLLVSVRHSLARWSEVKVAQSCPTLCDSVDYTVHGILQARILEWVAFPFSRGSSQPRDWTQVSHIAKHKITLCFHAWAAWIVSLGVVLFLPVCLVGLWDHHGSAAAQLPCSRHSRTQLTGQLLLGPLWLNGRETGGAGKAPWCSGLVFPSDAFHFPTLARASPCPRHPCPVGQECITYVHTGSSQGGEGTICFGNRNITVGLTRRRIRFDRKEARYLRLTNLWHINSSGNRGIKNQFQAHGLSSQVVVMPITGRSWVKGRQRVSAGQS